jgi:hypothetical protein
MANSFWRTNSESCYTSSVDEGRKRVIGECGCHYLSPCIENVQLQNYRRPGCCGRQVSNGRSKSRRSKINNGREKRYGLVVYGV